MIYFLYTRTVDHTYSGAGSFDTLKEAYTEAKRLQDDCGEEFVLLKTRMTDSGVVTTVVAAT